MALQLDGKTLSLKIQEEIAEEVKQRLAHGKDAPCLAAVLIGADPASETYVASKIKACERVGFTSKMIRLDESVSEEELIKAIKELNKDKCVTGFIVQLPLPKHIRETNVIMAIDPS